MKGADLVVGTAGHIDHGKTSLVRTLTGVDLDALPEERERGITIALGFTPLDLPTGRRVAFVDVPGHERLVRTMVAGATGVGAVLLCVSADDGVMPQTREHLAILDLLGVRRGAVVMTKADLVDEEMLELAQDDISDLLIGTFLEDAPIVPFSAVDGTGREAVLALLDELTTTHLAAGDPATKGPFRMPVDRAFSRQGFGTVVTGTVWSGTLTDGTAVRILPEGHSARVRGLQVHGEAATETRPGWRTALNLAGVDTALAGRGALIATGPVPCPLMVDVHYRHTGPNELEDGSNVRVLLGTSERIGRIHFASAEELLAKGDQAYAQLRLDGPLPCMNGDRFVLRRVSPVDTLGGGTVLDPYTKRMRAKSRELCGKQLERLHAGDTRVWLERAGEEGLDPADWAFRGGEGGELLGDRVFDPRVVARLKGGLLDALTAYHAEHTLSLGANRRELRRGRLAHLPDRVFDALVDQLAENSMIVAEGPLMRIAGFAIGLTVDQVELQEAIEGAIREAGLKGLSVKDLHTRYAHDDVSALIRLLEVGGTVVNVPGIGWMERSQLDGLAERIATYFQSNDSMGTADFKELSGLTRKAAIPLLEWLDKAGVTRRDGDVRRKG